MNPNVLIIVSILMLTAIFGFMFYSQKKIDLQKKEISKLLDLIQDEDTSNQYIELDSENPLNHLTWTRKHRIRTIAIYGLLVFVLGSILYFTKGATIWLCAFIIIALCGAFALIRLLFSKSKNMSYHSGEQYTYKNKKVKKIRLSNISPEQFPGIVYYEDGTKEIVPGLWIYNLTMLNKKNNT